MLNKREKIDLLSLQSKRQSALCVTSTGIAQNTTTIGNVIRQRLENNITDFTCAIAINDEFKHVDFTIVGINYSQSGTMTALDYITYDELLIESKTADFTKTRLYTSQIRSII